MAQRAAQDKLDLQIRLHNIATDVVTRVARTKLCAIRLFFQREHTAHDRWGTTTVRFYTLVYLLERWNPTNIKEKFRLLLCFAAMRNENSGEHTIGGALVPAPSGYDERLVENWVISELSRDVLGGFYITDSYLWCENLLEKGAPNQFANEIITILQSLKWHAQRMRQAIDMDAIASAIAKALQSLTKEQYTYGYVIEFKGSTSTTGYNIAPNLHRVYDHNSNELSAHIYLTPITQRRQDALKSATVVLDFSTRRRDENDELVVSVSLNKYNIGAARVPRTYRAGRDITLPLNDTSELPRLVASAVRKLARDVFADSGALSEVNWNEVVQQGTGFLGDDVARVFSEALCSALAAFWERVLSHILPYKVRCLGFTRVYATSQRNRYDIGIFLVIVVNNARIVVTEAFSTLFDFRQTPNMEYLLERAQVRYRHDTVVFSKEYEPSEQRAPIRLLDFTKMFAEILDGTLQWIVDNSALVVGYLVRVVERGLAKS